MTYTPLPNIACIAGLIVGLTLILGADLARAEMRSCTAEEAGRYETDDTLPVICDVMTVAGTRVANQPEQFAVLRPDAFRGADELKETGAVSAETISWSTTLTY